MTAQVGVHVTSQSYYRFDCADMCVDMCVVMAWSGGMQLWHRLGLYSYGMGQSYTVIASVGVMQSWHPSGLCSYDMRWGYVVMAWGGVM